jgi:phenylacetate-CoA ligase
VRHAYENVAFYRDLYDAHGVRPDDVAGAADLAALPLVSKGDLLLRPPEDLCVRGADLRRLTSVSSSGVTGEPFTVRRSRLERAGARLRWLKLLSAYGLRPWDRRASVHYLRSRPDGTQVHRKRRFFYPHLVIECRQPVEEICRTLRRYRPHFLTGYPGVLSLTAETLLADSGEPVRPRAVLLGSEVLTSDARRLIEEAFRAPVWDVYASIEMNLIATQCCQGRSLHVHDRHCAVEVLQDGRPVGPGGTGELVATNLDAFTMPFVRYRHGDVVTLGPDPCPCGRAGATLAEVQGRVVDYFPLPDGRLLHPYVLYGAVIEGRPWVRRYQFVQEAVDRVVVKVVPDGALSAQQLESLRHAAGAALGPQVNFEVQQVAALPSGPGGKFRVGCSLVKSAAPRPPALP